MRRLPQHPQRKHVLDIIDHPHTSELPLTARVSRSVGVPAPLPDVIRKDYDVLRFAYEWDFTPGAAAAR